MAGQALFLNTQQASGVLGLYGKLISAWTETRSLVFILDIR